MLFQRAINPRYFKGIGTRGEGGGRSDQVMVLSSVVCLCVLIIWVTAGQMPAVVAADKECFFLYVCVGNGSIYSNAFSKSH